MLKRKRPTDVSQNSTRSPTPPPPPPPTGGGDFLRFSISVAAVTYCAVSWPTSVSVTIDICAVAVSGSLVGKMPTNSSFGVSSRCCAWTVLKYCSDGACCCEYKGGWLTPEFVLCNKDGLETEKQNKKKKNSTQMLPSPSHLAFAYRRQLAVLQMLCGVRRSSSGRAAMLRSAMASLSSRDTNRSIAPQQATRYDYNRSLRRFLSRLLDKAARSTA